jgi:DNA (cytosine-5)-methyltransferase 1
MANSKPKAMDIFCGCGGTTQGLKDAGFSMIAGVENDPLAIATFRANHKRVKVWDEDICKLTPRQLLEHHRLRRGELDLLAGCPPCQAFSSMRRLNGRRRVRDRASKDLVFEYLRFVEGLRPKVVFIENVPGLLEDYRFDQIRSRLHKLGYIGDPAIFDASKFGVAQRRKRMIYIASRIGLIEYAEPLSDDERLTVRDVIGDLPEAGDSGDELHDVPENRNEKVARLIAMIPKDGGSRRDLGEKHQLECHKKCDGFKDVYGRMAWDQVAPTITSGCINPSKGRFLHPEQNRSITLREAALLQSFPSNYFFSLDRGKFEAALMIGNAFPPKFVKHHAVKIREHIQNNKTRRS